ncbi:MAG: FAD-dependent monooxygenase [Pseudomonadota bacterium]
MKAVIAGGGIGGLGAAISLALKDWEVLVLEQAPELTEIGAGLQISPNGWKVLDAMGVTPLIADALFEPEAIEMRVGKSGRTIFRLPMRAAARHRWGAPYIHIHRADLHEALAKRLQQLQPDAVQTASEVEGYSPIGEQVRVRLKGGRTRDADLLVGADGLHSIIRHQMLGADAPHYTGNLAWRAVVPAERLGIDAPPPSACIWVGEGKHAVTTRLRGGHLVNFVGMVEQSAPSEEGWRVEGSRDDARRDFEGWHPTIGIILDKADTLHRWALFDREPLPQWHDGRVVLLGDAAHPMMPSMAQGAVQALEDGWMLGGMLARFGTLAEGLAAFYAARLPRTGRIQRVSAANARMFHQASFLGKTLFYGPMAIGARILPGLIHRRQDWVYGYDAVSAVA